MEKSLKTIIEKCENYPRIYLLGPTGSGKSTLMCCFTNNPPIVTGTKGNGLILKGTGVGFGGNSCTTIPQIAIDNENKLIYCDSPGFNDTKGLEQEIINSFIIDYMLSSKNNQAKILLVVSVHELMAQRQQNFSETIEQ